MLSTTSTYAATAARGMIASMAHYGNSSPAAGDGRVSTPAWYANRLGKVLHATGDELPLPGEWWGWRYLAYAHQILNNAAAEEAKADAKAAWEQLNS